VLASSLIPGNENAVFRVINGLAKLGAHVVHKGNALVHVSGHAAAGELQYVYNIVKPRNVLPIHGEWRHMRANAAIAESVGIPPENVTLAEDGTVMDLKDGVVTVAGYLPVGFVYVDGSGVGDVTETSLKDRRVLGEEGFISVFVAVDIVDGVIVAGPEIHARGFGADKEIAGALTDQVTQAVEQALTGGADDTHELQQRIRRVVGTWVNSTHRRRPMIIPVVVEA
jgi:ribonuclease J